MVGHMRYAIKNLLKYLHLCGFVWGVHGGVFVQRDGRYRVNNMMKVLNNLKERLVLVNSALDNQL